MSDKLCQIKKLCHFINLNIVQVFPRPFSICYEFDSLFYSLLKAQQSDEIDLRVVVRADDEAVFVAIVESVFVALVVFAAVFAVVHVLLVVRNVFLLHNLIK